MKRYVSDTQCIIWYFTEDERRMPKVARSAFKAVGDGTAQVLIPSIVLVEALFLAERQRVPRAILAELMALSDAPTFSICVVPLDLAVARRKRLWPCRRARAGRPDHRGHGPRPEPAPADHRSRHRCERPGEGR